MSTVVVRSLGPRSRPRLWGPEHPFMNLCFAFRSQVAINLVVANCW
jgi:hypothetical protein